METPVSGPSRPASAPSYTERSARHMCRGRHRLRHKPHRLWPACLPARAACLSRDATWGNTLCGPSRAPNVRHGTNQQVRAHTEHIPSTYRGPTGAGRNRAKSVFAQLSALTGGLTGRLELRSAQSADQALPACNKPCDACDTVATRPTQRRHQRWRAVTDSTRTGSNRFSGHNMIASSGSVTLNYHQMAQSETLGRMVVIVSNDQ
jgi:hypothetical protein